MPHNQPQKVIIGSLYEITRSTLREKIRTGQLTGIESITPNHACYFCSKRIQKEMYTIQMELNQNLESFFLDKNCYQNAQALQYKEGYVIH